MALKRNNIIVILSILGVIFLFFNLNRLFFYANIDYNTQVKPILNKHCISCHGGVKQNGGFSLMTRTSALAINESGLAAIIPGEPDRSEMIRRLHLEDPDERMPQESSALSTEEIEILTKWVEQGAKWGLHWAYKPLSGEIKQATELGLFSNKNNISPTDHLDKFVKEKLSNIGLSPSLPAENSELLRRVSLDLIGVPAPSELQELFLTNQINYPSLVDSLLAMEAYGEKWATMWLDIARYADSKGYERDPNRTIWPYRDYVIKALNNDKPYDQFIIEQMAGDLLDDPSDEQYIATGFHRNTSTNDEGGTNNEEFRVKAVMDRVSTTWEGLMGTTMACVQCHGHPYDPFAHEEFYQSFAFLNNTRDADTHMDYPRLKILDTIQQEKLDSIKNWVENLSGPDKAKELVTFVKTVQPVIYSIETDQLKKASFYDTKYLGLRAGGQARLPNVKLDNITTLLLRTQSNVQKGTFFISLDEPTGPVISSIDVSKLNKRYGLIEIPLSKNEGIHDLYLHYENPTIKNKDTPGILFDWFYFTQEFPGKGNKEQHHYKKNYYELLAPKKEHTLIMRENPSDRLRKTHVFDRGNWLIPAKEVSPGVPSVLLKSDAPQPNNRLEFAEWIASEDNPLTARTFVNRVWEQLFGFGIVATTEDLGSQGAIPTHPELLDYLSYYWMHNQNWKIKDLIRSIVLSKTYNQSAKASPLSLEKDPYNKFLSRGPRVRLSAEIIRDQALSISGLLSDKMYGPPVMPFQPEGIWQSPYSNEKWSISEGEDKYRRGVYTMIKRSSIYPSMETFDAPQRLVCSSRRVNTNTPLQALVTLNDPVYVEASEFLADLMLRFGGKSISDQIDYAYRLAMSKPIAIEKRKVLENLYNKTFEELESEQNDCPPDSKTLALYTVANAILNLDELLTK